MSTFSSILVDHDYACKPKAGGIEYSMTARGDVSESFANGTESDAILTSCVVNLVKDGQEELSDTDFLKDLGRS